MLKCYGYHPGMAIDLDTVILYVERSGGHYTVNGDLVMFWVTESAAVMLACAWPDLIAQPDQDLWE